MIGLFKKKKKKAETKKPSGPEASGKIIYFPEDTLTHTEPDAGAPVDAVMKKGQKIYHVKDQDGWVQGKLPNGKTVWIPFFECKIIDKR